MFLKKNLHMKGLKGNFTNVIYYYVVMKGEGKQERHTLFNQTLKPLTLSSSTQERGVLFSFQSTHTHTRPSVNKD